jgi:hypothetical protein
VRCVAGNNPGGQKTDNDEAGFYRVDASPASDGRRSVSGLARSNFRTLRYQDHPGTPEDGSPPGEHNETHEAFRGAARVRVVANDSAGRHASVRCGDDSRREDRLENDVIRSG